MNQGIPHQANLGDECFNLKTAFILPNKTSLFVENGVQLKDEFLSWK